MANMNIWSACRLTEAKGMLANFNKQTLNTLTKLNILSEKNAFISKN
jgi:hypothetical protein